MSPKSHKRFFDSVDEPTDWIAAKSTRPNASPPPALLSAPNGLSIVDSSANRFSPLQFEQLVVEVGGSNFDPELGLASIWYTDDASPTPKLIAYDRDTRQFYTIDTTPQTNSSDSDDPFQLRTITARAILPAGRADRTSYFSVAVSDIIPSPTRSGELLIADGPRVLRLTANPQRPISPLVVPVPIAVSAGDEIRGVRDLLCSSDGERLYITMQYDRSIRCIDLREPPNGQTGHSQYELRTDRRTRASTDLRSLCWHRTTSPISETIILGISCDQTVWQLTLPVSFRDVIRYWIEPEVSSELMAHLLPRDLWHLIAQFLAQSVATSRAVHAEAGSGSGGGATQTLISTPAGVLLSSTAPPAPRLLQLTPTAAAATGGSDSSPKPDPATARFEVTAIAHCVEGMQCIRLDETNRVLYGVPIIDRYRRNQTISRITNLPANWFTLPPHPDRMHHIML